MSIVLWYACSSGASASEQHPPPLVDNRSRLRNWGSMLPHCGHYPASSSSLELRAVNRVNQQEGEGTNLYVLSTRESSTGPTNNDNKYIYPQKKTSSFLASFL